MKKTNSLKKSQNKNTIVRTNSHKLLVKVIHVLTAINPRIAVHFALGAFFTPLSRRKHAEKIPEGVRERSIKLLKKRVQVYSYGSSLKKILLLHGWEGASSDLSEFFIPLVNQGYEVHAIDLPGHGRSERSQLNAIMTANLVRELEKEVGAFSGIIAHSFGAFSAGFAIKEFSELSEIPFVSIGSPNRLTNILNNFGKMAGFDEIQSQYAFAKVEKDLKIRIKEFEHEQFLAKHQGPTLVIHDQKDKVVPINVIDEIQARTKKPEFFITSGLGHNRILKDKSTIEKVLTFLEETKDQQCRIPNSIRYGF